MRIRSPRFTPLAALAASIALSACESSTGAGMGTVQLHIASAGATDMVNAAVQSGFGDVTSVTVTISRAELVPGNKVIFPGEGDPESVTYDVLGTVAGVPDLVEGVAELLGSESIEAGAYEQLRLIVDEAFVAYGQDEPVEVDRLVPSGAQTGIKVNFGGAVALEPGGVVDVTAVISLEESFVFQGPPTASKGVSFKPVIHATVETQ